MPQSALTFILGLTARPEVARRRMQTMHRRILDAVSIIKHAKMIEFENGSRTRILRDEHAGIWTNTRVKWTDERVLGRSSSRSS